MSSVIAIDGRPSDPLPATGQSTLVLPGFLVSQETSADYKNWLQSG
jgi:hypothetical protein